MRIPGVVYPHDGAPAKPGGNHGHDNRDEPPGHEAIDLALSTPVQAYRRKAINHRLIKTVRLQEPYTMPAAAWEDQPGHPAKPRYANTDTDINTIDVEPHPWEPRR